MLQQRIPNHGHQLIGHLDLLQLLDEVIDAFDLFQRDGRLRWRSVMQTPEAATNLLSVKRMDLGQERGFPLLGVAHCAPDHSEGLLSGGLAVVGPLGMGLLDFDQALAPFRVGMLLRVNWAIGRGESALTVNTAARARATSPTMTSG
jgi:hypothetical protein